VSVVPSAFDKQPPLNNRPRIMATVGEWWLNQRAQQAFWPTVREMAALIWQFLSDSTPARRRQRYGDIDYDWEYRVDTTGATVSGLHRFLGLFHSPYQPTEPALFREMLGCLTIDFREFTFMDLGSGKGRVLLMASDYPFRRIIGVEVLPELHRVAAENVRKYRSDAQLCFEIQSACADARQVTFPCGPLVLYLFNPLSETGLQGVIANLQKSLRHRRVHLVYHNPLLEPVLVKAGFKRIAGTHQYVIYAAQL
jgi:SAM-dependent methyltransferase